ncbi:MAG: ABC transporter permease [Clostridia bacterium]|nr:ABC transporter permease [Clostridia bacterium]
MGVALLIQYTLIFASVLSVVAIGGMFSERSGVINLGLEGCMVMGALAGALVMHFLPDETSGFVVVLLTLLASITTGMIYSMLLAVAAIKFKADQTITGTAMNILAPALATAIVKAITLNTGDHKASPYIYYVNAHDHFIIKIGSFELNWFIILMVITVALAYVILYKTRFGLRLMSCGEHPQAAASNGINVIKLRYVGVLISGALSGLGGIAFINSANSSWPFDSGVVGFGFLALAVMIFGKWKPINIFLGALLFSLFRALGSTYTAFEFLQNLEVNAVIYNMLPYIVCLIILAITSKNSKAPKAEGIPYDKGMR